MHPTIIVIAVTQRPSADVLGGLDARTQMTVRIALGVVEPRDGELILGAGRLSAGWRADRLAGPGYFLVLAPGQHEQLRPARAYWLTDAAVWAAARPSWQRTGGAGRGVGCRRCRTGGAVTDGGLVGLGGRGVACGRRNR